MALKDPTERMVLNAATDDWQEISDVGALVMRVSQPPVFINIAATIRLIHELVESGHLEQRESGKPHVREVRLTPLGISRRNALNRGQPHTTPDGTTLHREVQKA